MSMLDGLFKQGFKAPKCKTLLKLTIPRIKLLRNRREIQIKQMRKDIAKLLQTGQEATARIRVEHIIREENMMAAQEIIELFSELIAVRLPIIETQRECPLDLKEAISSLCFAAPRCADLPELLQVQMLFVSKYGKEFVAAATELMPDCGVNRQLIELLSIRAPAPDVKLKLLKEIAEEHDLDWDPAASETELFKSHEDLLNGPNQFVSGSKLPLPKEKHDDSLHSPPDETPNEESDSHTGLDTLDFPEVPKVSLWRSGNVVSGPEMLPFPTPSAPHSDIHREVAKQSGPNETLPHEPESEPVGLAQDRSAANGNESEEKQFVPFISPPSLASASFPARKSKPSPALSTVKSVSAVNVDLQDVVTAAHAAADSAERAAAAARSAASLAQMRISELMKKNDHVPETSIENPFHTDTPIKSDPMEKPCFDHQNSFGVSHSPDPPKEHEIPHESVISRLPSYDDHENPHEPVISSLPSYDDGPTLSKEQENAPHQPHRLPSMGDDPYFSYPNLFTASDSNHGSAH